MVYGQKEGGGMMLFVKACSVNLDQVSLLRAKAETVGRESERCMSPVCCVVFILLLVQETAVNGR
jgi:hypothetical protein